METQMALPEMIHKVSWSPSKMSRTIRSPIKIFGGKFYLSAAHLDVCLSAMYQCRYWKEGCAGGANFTLQSEPRDGTGAIRFLIESNPLIWNVWYCYCNPEYAKILVEQLRMIRPTTKEEMEGEFSAAKMVCEAHLALWKRAGKVEIPPNARIALALARIVLARMSRGGMGKDFAWQERERGGKPGEVNSWQTFIENHSPRVAARCVNVVPILGDIETYIEPDNQYRDGGINNPDAFWYFDPPYLQETRSAKEVYGEDEWSAEKHARFVKTVRKAESKVAICGYDSPLYRAALNKDTGWTLHRFAIVNHSGQGKTKQDRIECLFTNF